MKRNMLNVIFGLLLLPFAACEEESDTPDESGNRNSGQEANTDNGSKSEVDQEEDTGPGSADAVDTEEKIDDKPAEEVGFPLAVGDPVPDFSLPAHSGSTFTLSDYRGKSVVIGSHPFAGTAVCTQQTKDLETNFDKFAEYNAVPFALGVDGSARQASWASQMGLEKLWILSDSNPKGEISKMFGIYDGMTKSSKRAVVIIDHEGKVAFKRVYNTMICPKLDPIFEELD